MKFSAERDFILQKIREAFSLFGGIDVVKEKKSAYDLVTNIDKSIEGYLKAEISKRFPQDNVIAEETSGKAPIIHRTWTIDPIDGTLNLAHGINMYGVQCSLLVDGKISVAAIILKDGSEYWAVDGEGAFRNGERLQVAPLEDIATAMVAMGDFSHKSPFYAEKEYKAFAKIYPRVAKMRMYGAGCHDFTYLASGKLDTCAVFTDNLWDLCPGVLICKEAGAIVTALDGKPYKTGDFGVLASCGETVHKLMLDAFNG